jgi:L-malate glycosyltransferase
MAPAPGGCFLFVLPWELDLAGGVNTVVRSLMAEALAQGSVAPVLLVRAWEEPSMPQVSPRGLRCTRLPLRTPFEEPSAPVRSALSFLVTLPLMMWRLSRLLRAHQVAVVNAHFPGPYLLVFGLMRFFRMMRSPLLLSIHGQDVDRARASRGLRRMAWDFLFSSSDAVVACSRHLADSLLEEFPHLRVRTTVIRNGVDARTLQAGSKTGTLPPEIQGVPYVLSVGTFEEKKGHDILVRAFERLAFRHPGLHLAVVGRSGPALPPLREYRSRSGLSDRVHFFEDVPYERIGVFYDNATVVAFPSRREPLGIAGLEAGVFGKPLVASRVGGIPEYVHDGVNGILVTPEDVPALAEAIGRLLEDPALGAELGRRLRQDVMTGFSRERMWREYLAAAGFETREPR